MKIWTNETLHEAAEKMADKNFIWNGMQVIVIPPRKVQVKTHRNKLINWVFKKLYGYMNEYLLDEKTPAVIVDKTIYLRDESVLNDLKELCEVKERYERSE